MATHRLRHRDPLRHQHHQHHHHQKLLQKLRQKQTMKTSCVLPFAAFWVMSTLAKPSFWTNSVTQTFKTARPAESRNKSAQRTFRRKTSAILSSVTANKRPIAKFLACCSSIHPVTNRSQTCDRVAVHCVTSRCWSSTLCTASNHRPSNPSIYCVNARHRLSLHSTKSIGCTAGKKKTTARSCRRWRHRTREQRTSSSDV